MSLSRLGPFAVEERLGGSDNQSVYRAVHIQQRRSVALKVFPAPLVSSDARAKAALVDEIEALKQLQHPHIARCFGGILEQSQGCIASELIEGESLSSLLARRQRLSWETVAEYAQQICSALEYAHAAGIFHQDLTPDKILVNADDQVKIIDFRVARATNATCITSNKKTLPRVAYLSPEQLRGETLTAKSDLYSLGCVMYEMLVGQPPFLGETPQAVAEQHVQAEAEAVDSIVFDCPVWLGAVVHQLMAKEVTDRPHSAAAVRMALQETHQRVAAKTGVVEHAAGGFSTLQRQVDKDVARKLLYQARVERRDRQQRDQQRPPFFESPWFLAGCLLLLCGSIGAYLLWPVNEEKLFARAETIMIEKEGIQQEQARPLLEELLERFPAGPHADDARVFVDELDMASAERKLRIRTQFGREPKSEGERLYAEAWNIEQFGDRLTALEKYHSMVHLLPDDGQDRPYVNLARRQIAAIERETSPEDRLKFIEDQLTNAETLAQQGRLLDARKIWSSVVTLYGGNREFSVHVQRAQSRLDGVESPPERDS